MFGLTLWSILVPFNTHFLVSSFGKVPKITGSQRFGCLVEPYFFSILFYTHTYFLAQTALQDHALKTIHIGKMLGQSTLHILGDGNYPTGRSQKKNPRMVLGRGFRGLGVILAPLVISRLARPRLEKTGFLQFWV